MDKSEIRKYIKKLLKENISSLKLESDRICKSIINSEAYKNAETIIAYMALPDEVDLTEVIQTALSQEKKVFLPHVYEGTSKMEFFQFTKTTPTVTGAFGIEEPQFSENTPAFTADNKQTLFLIPGRAFTKACHRLGRGKGFYDIYLSSLKNNSKIKKAGICFPLQVLQEIPTTPYDIKMDILFY